MCSWHCFKVSSVTQAATTRKIPKRAVYNDVLYHFAYETRRFRGNEVVVLLIARILNPYTLNTRLDRLTFLVTCARGTSLHAQQCV